MLRALLCLLLAACSSSSAQPAPPVGDPVLLQLDLAGCRPLVGASYDGDLWLLDGGGLRCPVQIQAGDVITEWAVYGRRDAAGFPAARLCLQYLETVLTPEARRHRSIGCSDAYATGPDDTWAASGKPAAPIHTSEDEAWSLFVTGNGDLVGAAIVYVTRP